jgi:hypothetical protein
MSAVSVKSGECTVVFSQEERELLLSILEPALRDKQVEVHRTDALEFKEQLERQEALLRGALDKLRRS